MVRTSTNMHKTTFTDLDNCQRMTPLRDLFLMTLTYFLSSNIFNFNISETQTCEMTLSTWNFSKIFSVLKSANDHLVPADLLPLAGTRHGVALVISSIVHIVASYDLEQQQYADDTQLYYVVISHLNHNTSLSRLEECSTSGSAIMA